jgi:hypothetical protein
MAAPNARFPLAATLAAIALFLGPSACGTPSSAPDSAASLLSGSRAPISPAELDRAATAARRFARAYARSIYRAQPPTLPGATARITAALRAATTRVPPARRLLATRVGRIDLEPGSTTRVAARVTILDGHSPPFTVGFGLEQRGRHWLVSSISPPG